MKAGAAALVDEGNALFKRRQFKAALEKFQAAFALHSDPRIILNIAEAHRELGDPDSAAGAYEQYLAQAPSDASKTRSKVEQRLRELRPSLCFLDIRASVPNASISVDGRPMGTAPREVRVSRGAHEIEASASGAQPAHARVDAVPGRSIPVILALPSLAAQVNSTARSSTTASSGTALNLSSGATAKTSTVATTVAANSQDFPWWWIVAGIAAAGAAVAITAVAVGSGGDPVPSPELGFLSTSGWRRP